VIEAMVVVVVVVVVMMMLVGAIRSTIPTLSQGRGY